MEQMDLPHSFLFLCSKINILFFEIHLLKKISVKKILIMMVLKGRASGYDSVMRALMTS